MVIFTARHNLANLNEVKMNLIVKFANLAGKSYTGNLSWSSNGKWLPQSPVFVPKFPHKKVSTMGGDYTPHHPSPPPKKKKSYILASCITCVEKRKNSLSVHRPNPKAVTIIFIVKLMLLSLVMSTQSVPNFSFFLSLSLFYFNHCSIQCNIHSIKWNLDINIGHVFRRNRDFCNACHVPQQAFPPSFVTWILLAPM